MFDRLAYWLYRCAGAPLLPLRLVCALGRLGGLLAYFLAVPYRRLALRNLRIAFGEELTARDRRRLAREHFATLGSNLLASLRVARLPREKVREIAEIERMGIAER